MNKDVLSGAILLALGAAYYWATLQIPGSSLSDDVGAQGLPTILAILLVTVAALIIGRGIIIARRPLAVAAMRDDDDEPDARPQRALGLIGISFGYVLLAPFLGYGPALALLIAAVATYEGVRPSWRLAAVAAGGAVVFWIIFVQLLGVEQPASILL